MSLNVSNIEINCAVCEEPIEVQREWGGEGLVVFPCNNCCVTIDQVDTMKTDAFDEGLMQNESHSNPPF